MRRHRISSLVNVECLEQTAVQVDSQQRPMPVNRRDQDANLRFRPRGRAANNNRRAHPVLLLVDNRHNTAANLHSMVNNLRLNQVQTFQGQISPNNNNRIRADLILDQSLFQVDRIKHRFDNRSFPNKVLIGNHLYSVQPEVNNQCILASLLLLANLLLVGNHLFPANQFLLDKVLLLGHLRPGDNHRQEVGNRHIQASPQLLGKVQADNHLLMQRKTGNQHCLVSLLLDKLLLANHLHLVNREVGNHHLQVNRLLLDKILVDNYLLMRPEVGNRRIPASLPFLDKALLNNHLLQVQPEVSDHHFLASLLLPDNKVHLV